MSETLTHIAGVAINIGGRKIQRCSLCGEKLIDALNQAAPLNHDGSVPLASVWECGRLVQCATDGNPRRWSLLPDTDQLPEDSCLALVE